MNQDEAHEIAQLVAKELATELRKIIEPVMITMVALELRKASRVDLDTPLTLEEAVSMAMSFIHQTRRQIYPHIVGATDGTRLEGYPAASDESTD
jgi:hypothetical protein